MIPTDLSQLIGNNLVKTYLKRMVSKNAVGHSLLFAGPDGIGKSLFGQVLATLLMSEKDPQGKHRQRIEKGQHPDIHILRPEGKLGLHSIQSLRQFNDEVAMPPYEAPWKVFIIHEADRMLSYSANALLKTFEEPPSQTLIILLSSHPKTLLSTITSRCRTIFFQPVESSEIANFLIKRYKLEDSMAQQMAHLAQGSISRAIRLVEQKGDPNREFLLNLLAGGKLDSYKTLTEAVHHLTNQVEGAKKLAEEHAKVEIYKTSSENLSVSQQLILEKELEGAISLSQGQEVHSLLEHLLSWYRDLHLLHINGSVQYLMNLDYLDPLQQAIQRGEIYPLEKVQKAIDETHLDLQRSTSLQVCLENLFLKLNLI